MSGIVLSASVRQNLLSLQSTADLLSTTQNRLATGNKVNSALDNPTNFFTAQGLNNRASDINNLLDSIGNGVQVLQAANTGITSLQKLVDTAKSIANQVLQAPTGYSTKSQRHCGSGHRRHRGQPDLTAPTRCRADILTITATGGGTATSITFGTGAAEVDTLTSSTRRFGGQQPARLQSDDSHRQDHVSPRPTTRLRPRSARSAVPRSAHGKAFLPRVGDGRCGRRRCRFADHSREPGEAVQ